MRKVPPPHRVVSSPLGGVEFKAQRGEELSKGCEENLKPDCMSGAMGGSLRGGGGGGARVAILFTSAAARFHHGPLPASCSACIVRHDAQRSRRSGRTRGNVGISYAM